MDTLSAFARGAAAQGQRQRVFDWDKAAEMIRKLKPENASAGLSQDWEYTGGTIYRDGAAYRDGGCYLSSNWAVPELDLDGTVVDCWKYQDETPGWDAGTVWPESALTILEAV